MNQVEILKRKIEADLPGVVATVDRPSNTDSPWMLDVSFREQTVNIEWRPRRGFGVSTIPHAFGEGPDEVFSRMEDALNRVIQLLRSRESTTPPRECSLSE